MEPFWENFPQWTLSLLVLLGTVIQITPVKLNPWSALFRWIGKTLNAETISKLNTMEKEQATIRATLDEHIRVDDERCADGWRRQILSFNASLLKGTEHTKEEFTEILAVIDSYEKYCTENPGYKNNRAAHATAHILKTYDDRLEKRDFLKESDENRKTSSKRKRTSQQGGD